IFETTAARALGGRAAGIADGALAADHARRLEPPAGTVIYATVDMDPAAAVLRTIGDYDAAFASALGEYRAGLYACGAVLAKSTSLPWLAGAAGWNGSRAYDTTGNWALKQGPQLNHGGSWAGIDWPDLGFPYDPDLIAHDDIGAWSPSGAVEPV